MKLGYKAIMQANSRQVHNSAISTKILQLMDKIRDYSTEGQARRWVWELIQNAKDASYKDRNIKIKIELFEDKMVFSHNGRAFLVKNILSIINQVSSKNSNSDEETTGKFGTGFISTHLLSEIVKLDGILQDKDVNTNEDLPAKKFSILLDRSGKNTDEIIASVEKSLHKIELLDDEPDLTVFPEFTTSFTYMLDNEISKKSAKIGIEDLEHSILYAIAFVERLDEIHIINHIDNTSKIFVRGNNQACSNYDGLSLLEINENKNIHKVLKFKQGTTIIATEVNNNKFLPINTKTPRIFVDFPLIGSELFPFPVVMCDRNLLPDEPRSWIPLSEKSASKNSQNNKEILKTAINHCNTMFKYACELGYDSFYEVCKIQPLQPRADFDLNWYKNYILNPFWNEFNTLSIVNTSLGRTSLNNKNLLFPVSNEHSEINAIYELLNDFEQSILPDKEDINDWSEVFSLMQELPKNTYTLEKLVDLAQTVSFDENDSFICWIQKLYNAVLNNNKLKDELKAGNINILPDQNQKSKLHSINNMYIDQDIDEALKKAMCEFNIIAKYSGYEQIDIYSILIHKDFDIGDIYCKPYPVQELLNKIDSYSNRYLRVTSYTCYRDTYINAWFRGWLHMLSCYRTNIWFDFASDVFPNSTKELEYNASKYSEQDAIWKNSIIGIRTLICDKIHSNNTFEGLKLNVISSPKNEIEWLFEFIDNGFKVGNINEFINYSIFPNQNNQFCVLNTLRRDCDIDEELKDIAVLISKNHDIKNLKDVLIHKSFKTETNYIDNMYEREVATDIARAIDNVLNSGGLSETDELMQEACTRLLSWIEDNPQKASNLFTHYTSEESRMKLLTPKAACKMSKRLKEIENIMKNFNINDLEQLEEIIKEKNNNQIDNLIFEFSDVLSHEKIYEFENYEDDLREYCRQIGVAGEKIAFNLVAKDEIDNGAEVIEQCENQIILQKNSDKIVVKYLDTDSYKQEGFDIVKTIISNDKAENMYYEVKTTTRSDYFKYINLSKYQLNYSIQNADNYNIIRLLVENDSFNLIKAEFISNIISSLSNGKITPEIDNMVMRIN